MYLLLVCVQPQSMKQHNQQAPKCSKKKSNQNKTQNESNCVTPSGFCSKLTDNRSEPSRVAGSVAVCRISVHRFGMLRGFPCGCHRVAVFLCVYLLACTHMCVRLLKSERTRTRKRDPSTTQLYFTSLKLVRTTSAYLYRALRASSAQKTRKNPVKNHAQVYEFLKYFLIASSGSNNN